MKKGVFYSEKCEIFEKWIFRILNFVIILEGCLPPDNLRGSRVIVAGEPQKNPGDAAARDDYYLNDLRSLQNFPDSLSMKYA